VAVVVLENVLAVTLPLSKALQSPTVDLMQALANVKSVSDLLQRKRDNADDTFTDI